MNGSVFWPTKSPSSTWNLSNASSGQWISKAKVWFQTGFRPFEAKFLLWASPLSFFINVFTDCSGFEALLVTRQSDDFHLYHRRADAFIVVLSGQVSTGNNLNVKTDRTRGIYLEFIWWLKRSLFNLLLFELVKDRSVLQAYSVA